MPEPAESQAGGRGRFPAEFRIRKTDDYSSVFAFRKVLRGRFFSLHYRPNSLPTARLGLVVAKKLARRAVLRNLVKRLARETFRVQRESLPCYDLVVRLNASPLAASRVELRGELERLFARLGA